MANCNGTAKTVSAIRQLKMACLTVMALRSGSGSMPRKDSRDDRIHGIFVVISIDDTARLARGRYALSTLVIAPHVEANPCALVHRIPEQCLLALAIHRQMLNRAFCAQKSSESGNLQRPRRMQISISFGQKPQVDL